MNAQASKTLHPGISDRPVSKKCPLWVKHPVLFFFNINAAKSGKIKRLIDYASQ
jgi:hypothetical protein